MERLMASYPNSWNSLVQLEEGKGRLPEDGGMVSGCHPTKGHLSERRDSFLPGIRKEDVGQETIMVHFKGGKTEPDYPGEKMA